MPEQADIVVIGAGIIGLATARALIEHQPGLDVRVLDKEDRVAAHQSGNNSGVIHSGIYYRPDSDKAAMVAAGRRRLLEFAARHHIDHELCGKVVVATSVDQLRPLEDLRERAAANEVEAVFLSRSGLRELEPHCDGLAALHVPSAGIIDFTQVCDALVTEVVTGGGVISLSHQVETISEHADGVRVQTPEGVVSCRMLVNCGGLQADRLATQAAQQPAVRIMPFRGEYFEIAPEQQSLVNNMIYPLPDPRFPFLGMHLTRSIDGARHAGPNAVAALTREGYRWGDVDAAGLRELFAGADSRRLARRYWRAGAAEIIRSLSHRASARAVGQLVPELGAGDLTRSGSGVRAQAIRPDGTLLDDFAFVETERVVSVLNAPSPAATASLEIGDTIARRVLSALALSSPGSSKLSEAGDRGRR